MSTREDIITKINTTLKYITKSNGYNNDVKIVVDSERKLFKIVANSNLAVAFYILHHIITYDDESKSLSVNDLDIVFTVKYQAKEDVEKIIADFIKYFGIDAYCVGLQGIDEIKEFHLSEILNFQDLSEDDNQKVYFLLKVKYIE